MIQTLNLHITLKTSRFINRIHKKVFSHYISNLCEKKRLKIITTKKITNVRSDGGDKPSNGTMTESAFYRKAATYWANVPATIDGVLGGFGHISDTDIDGSKAFLDEILAFDNPPATKLALDCGAGIGRVSKYVLIPRFDKVDLVEQDEKFINTAKLFIGKDNHKIGTLYKVGLQSFKPQKTYDLIWCQWVLGHIKDYDLIDFLERCRISLNENGVIIVKENITTSNELDYDDNDSSVTRPLSLFVKLFEEAKLKIVKTAIQKGFPDDIYPVYSIALTEI